MPGDVIDLAYSDLATFPADIIMLSGDAIVNESMLTGESVPVSKSPIEAAIVKEISGVGGELPPSLAKHIVFSGTKVVRVRRTEVGPNQLEAVGMVLRTGFNTTKGYVNHFNRTSCKACSFCCLIYSALVRSMLFPRPLG